MQDEVATLVGRQTGSILHFIMRTPHTARPAEFVWDLVYHITKATLSVYLMQKRETGCFSVSQKSRQKTAHEDVWKAPGLCEPRGTVPRDHDTQPMRGEVPRVEIKKPPVGTELSDLETTASWPFPSGRPGLRRPGTAGAPVHTLSGAPVRSPRAPRGARHANCAAPVSPATPRSWT